MESFAVQASIAANTWVVSGSPQTKSKLIFIFFLHLVCCKIELSLCYLIWYVLCQILTSIERAFSMSLSIMQVCDHSCSANLQALQALIPLWAWTSLFNVLSHWYIQTFVLILEQSMELFSTISSVWLESKFHLIFSWSHARLAFYFNNFFLFSRVAW